MNKYTNEQTQEFLAIRLADQKKYIKLVIDKLNQNGLKTEKIIFDSDYIDEILKVKNKLFIFRMTMSNHKVGLSIKSIWWKIRSDYSGITKNYRKKRNPITYVENVFNKVIKETLKFDWNEVFFVYPVKNPDNKVPNINNHFVGNETETIDFILKRAF